MSRRCRPGLQPRGSGVTSTSVLDSGCTCGRDRGSGIVNPCAEPLVYATNILPDPSLERHIAATGGGPNGDEVPYATSGGGMFWPSNDLPVGGFNKSGWNGSGVVHTPGVSSTVPFWKVSTTNPRFGAHHLRFTTPPSAGGQLRDIRLVGFMDCDGDISTDHVSLSGRVGPGDLVVFSFYIMQANSASSTLTARIRCLGDAPGAPGMTGGTRSQVFSGGFSTVDYEQISIFMIVPQIITFWEPTGFVIADLVSMNSFGNSNMIDIDDFSLGVIVAGTDLALCSQFSLVTIDNSTTETDFL